MGIQGREDHVCVSAPVSKRFAKLELAAFDCEPSTDWLNVGGGSVDLQVCAQVCADKSYKYFARTDRTDGNCKCCKSPDIASMTRNVNRDINIYTFAHPGVVTHTAQDCQPSTPWTLEQQTTGVVLGAYHTVQYCAVYCMDYDYFGWSKHSGNLGNCKCCKTSGSPGTLNANPKVDIYSVGTPGGSQSSKHTPTTTSGSKHTPGKPMSSKHSPTKPTNSHHPGRQGKPSGSI
jgi:hypothetical protein